MTSHELARKLLESPDLPLFITVVDWESGSPENPEETIEVEIYSDACVNILTWQ